MAGQEGQPGVTPGEDGDADREEDERERSDPRGPATADRAERFLGTFV